MDDSSANLKPSEMDPEDLPDVEAFNDEFTREFLQSTEETEEGFYPFLSKTGKYKMDFPVVGVIDDISYFVREEKNYEEVNISIKDDTGFSMEAIYDAGRYKEILEDDLERFQDRLGYNGDFEELEKNDRTIYYTYIEYDVLRTYAAYIFSKKMLGL